MDSNVLLQGVEARLTCAPHMATNLPSRPRAGSARQTTIAIVASQYHEMYLKGLLDHARAELEAIAPGTVIQLYEVPGSFEIPLVVQEVAVRGGSDAIIAFGVIIEGQTAHARLIAETITASLQRIALQQRVPVIHEVL